MIRIVRRGGAAVVGAVAAVALASSASPASATSGPTFVENWDARCLTSGNVCVHDSAYFNGRTALYEDVDTECVTVPFGVLAAINMTDGPVRFYATTDCTGRSYVEPAENFHSWLDAGPRYSFRM
ncbi:hypothetical protein KBZ94_35650 [Streptomyces sp. RM72]|uniref:hypothetical protein n=1 Tax=Streptomyces TaxID=1883 RepID=UPI001B380A25|nr:hypothetical protein [Streptomyces sp. RM72]MBQ0890196.1 hypothetical protein [Streptomyces sp. RM72]